MPHSATLRFTDRPPSSASPAKGAHRSGSAVVMLCFLVTLFASIAGAGEISGTITSTATGLPISGVSTFFYDSAGVYKGAAVTNASGVYTTALGLPAGTYYGLTGNGQGYVNEYYGNIPNPGNYYIPSVLLASTPISVAGGVTGSINFALDPGSMISGNVTSSATGLPVSGVTVWIYKSSGAAVAFTPTDASGNWLVTTGLTAGSYRSRASNSLGFVNEIYNNISSPGTSFSTSELIAGTPISVTAGATTTGVNYALAPGGTLSGVVTSSATGLPISGVTVSLYSSVGSFVMSVNTDASGNWSVPTGLLPGSYRARASNTTGYANEIYNDISSPGSSATTSAIAAGTPIAVTAGVATTGINFALDPGGTVSGVVTSSATGLPIYGVTVGLYTSQGSNVLNATTNASGAWSTTTALPVGSYRARTSNVAGFVNEIYDNISSPGTSVSTATLSSGSPITLTAGGATTGINFALDPGGTVSGIVTSSATGLPISGVTVSIYSSVGSLITSATSNASGVWSYTGLSTGSYRVRTSNSAGYINEIYNNIPSPGVTVSTAALIAGTPINVTAGSTTSGLNFALDRGGTISGVVTSEATGLPISGAIVTVYNNAGSSVGSVSTSGSGVWSFTTGLPAGSYRARASNSLGYVNEFFDNITSPGNSFVTSALVASTPIDVVPATTTTGVNFALAPGGTMSGTITSSATGLPISGVSLEISADGDSVATTASTNASGVWSVTTGLPTGSYYVSASSNTSGFVNEVFNNRTCVGCMLSSGDAITITAPAATSNVDFQLSPGGRISGTVTDLGSGLPISGASVSIYTNGGSFATSTVTDAAGAFLTEDGLPTGQYRAVFLGNPRVTTAYNAVPCVSCSVAESATPISVTSPGTTAGVDVQLPLGGGITGTVRDVSTSLPVAGASVVIYESTGRRVSTTTTLVDGTFTRTGLPAATYYAEALAPNYAPQVFNAVCSNCAPTTGTPVVVTGTATTENVDFNLAAGASRPSLGSTVASIPGLSGGGATLRFSVNPHGLATSLSVDYGLTAGYGQSSAAVAAGSAIGSVTKGVNLTGLSCATAYHYRGVATNVAGTTYGRDDVFITSPCGGTPALSVSNATVAEGNSGTANATFTVSLSEVSAQTVTVLAATSAGTALAPTDYDAVGATLLTFNPGETSKPFPVAVVGDGLSEADETFFVTLSTPVNATLADGSGLGTITNDDAFPTLSINDVTILEGHTGSANAVFTVSLSTPSGQQVTVFAATSNLTAIAGSDYAATGPSPLSFAAGVTSKTFAVPVLGDTDSESNEMFVVTLSSPVNATILDGSGTGTITNDDGSPPTRIFVSASGNDANDCSAQTTPCRNLVGALSQVAAEGEIIVLSTGEYESAPLLIGKSVKITSPSGTVALIRQPITVNAPGGRVVLRGLDLKGSGSGNGITLAAADMLSIEDTTLDRWADGLRLNAGLASQVSVLNSVFRNNVTGVRDAGSSSSNRVSIAGARFERNGTGLDVQGGVHGVSDSTFVGNTSSGISATSSVVNIRRSEFFLNAAGVATFSGATVRIGRSHVFGNTVGLDASGGGSLSSSGTNVIRRNGTSTLGAIGSLPEN